MRKRAYAFVALAVLSLLLSAGNFLWTSQSVNEEQGKWCALIVTLDQANAAAARKPAPGSVAAAYAAEIRQLRQDLGCP